MQYTWEVLQKNEPIAGFIFEQDAMNFVERRIQKQGISPNHFKLRHLESPSVSITYNFTLYNNRTR